MATTPPPAKKKNSLLPILLIVGVGAAYLIYSKKQSAAATAAAAQSASPASAALTPTPAGTYDPNADTSALLGYLTGLNGQGSTASTTSSGATSTTSTYKQVPGNGAAANETLDILGSIIGPGGNYQGYNVVGGVPVYALVNGTWTQGFNAATLPVGTPLATSTTNEPYISSGAQVKETL